MIIQNISSAASAPGFTSDSAPVAVAVAAPRTASADAVKAVAETAQPTLSQVKNAVDNINRAMKQSNSNVEFSIDQDTRQTVIKVVESGTGDLIRQFPSAEVLSISREIDRVQQQGLLLKQEA